MDQESVTKAWSEIAINIANYRQMYALSEEIITHSSASAEVRNAARRVKAELRSIIDKPIAPAKQLYRARRKFQKLTALLGNAA